MARTPPPVGPSMRRLGTVLHVTRNGYIVVALEDKDHIPSLNVNVYDERRRKLGTLLDIIGPVEEPYAVVKPSDKSILNEVARGAVLYYEEPRPRRRRRLARKRAQKRISKKGRPRSRTGPKPVRPQGGGRGKVGGEKSVE